LTTFSITRALIMIELSPNRIRKILIPGAFFFLASLAVSIHSMEAEILLTPPGLRLIRDPSLVIPADFHYANRLIKLPAYRDPLGNPASGWSAKFVDTRRFASDQSAWIFSRNSDLQQSVSKPKERGQGAFRFWPAGTTIIIEIYKGGAFQKENDKLIEIAATSKISAERNSYSKAFYPVNWTYARFNPDGTPSITAAKVRECHQCHSIAFHLTGDLVFTQFP
jgi:hypothetical protein